MEAEAAQTKVRILETKGATKSITEHQAMKKDKHNQKDLARSPQRLEKARNKIKSIS